VISTSPQQHVTRRAFAGTLAVMATALAWPVSAQTPAASPEPTEAPRFFIHPLDETAQGYPDLTLEPGESATLNVGVTVQGEVATELTIYRADTIPATGGGFAAAELDDEPTGQTLWMDIEPTTFQGEPGSTYEFSVPVTVPEDAAPGQYVTALVVQTNPLEISAAPRSTRSSAAPSPSSSTSRARSRPGWKSASRRSSTKADCDSFASPSATPATS